MYVYTFITFSDLKTKITFLGLKNLEIQNVYKLKKISIKILKTLSTSSIVISYSVYI